MALRTQVLILVGGAALVLLASGWADRMGGGWWWGGAATLWALWVGWALAFQLRLSAALTDLVQTMEHIRTGNLRTAAAPAGLDELSQARRLLDDMARTVSAMVADVRSNAALVAQAGQQLIDGNDTLAKQAQQQASRLSVAAASVAQMSAALSDGTQGLEHIRERTHEFRAVADRSADAMTEMVQSIADIQRDSRRMADSIGTIDGMAYQTHLLTLNAAVKAARAGEQGRGFAVVATAVRQLAQRSRNAAQEIGSLIRTAGEQVNRCASLVSACGSHIGVMAGDMREVSARVADATQASTEQTVGIAVINETMAALDTYTRRSAEQGLDALVQAQQLGQRAEILSAAVATFRLNQGTADEALQLVRRAQDLHASGLRGRVWLQQITDPAQPFHDRDMYVFVLDAQGHYLAFGGQPAKVGSRVQDIPGVQGAQLLAAICSQTDRAAGWVEYDITNPGTGRVQTKMSYVMKLDGLYLGCGVYQRLAG